MRSLITASAANHDLIVGVLPFVVGIVIVVGIVTAMVLDRRKRLREPKPRGPQPRAGAWHTREEYGAPTPDDHGPGHQDADPVGYEHATREPEELAPERRLRPHEVRDYPGPRT